MLLKLVVLGLESDVVLFNAGFLRAELEVKGVVGLRHNCKGHRRALEGECLVCDSVEAHRGRDLTFVFQNNLVKRFFLSSGPSEAQNRCAICLYFLWLCDLERRKSSFTSELKEHLALLRIKFSILDDCLKETAILLHFSGLEPDSDVLVLVWND